MLPKHKYLLTYRYSELIFDGTEDFCIKYLSYQVTQKIPTRRTVEQMTQAARSGKQNIVEGVGQSDTSKKGEIKLLGVAKASIEELIADFEDFLRRRNLKIYPKDDPRVLKYRQIAFRLSNLSNLSDLGELIEKIKIPNNPEEAANFMFTICHQESYLLFKQVKSLEEKFVKEGGFTENLFKKRLRNKMNK